MENKETLQVRLTALKNENISKIPQEVVSKLLKELQELIDSGIVDKAPKKGDKFKNFILPNHLGKDINLSSLTEQGPVVVLFYRGGWCPYCNLELNAYQKALPEIKATGATLVAITPELPDSSMSTMERHNIEFDVLTDLNSSFAKELGITFVMEEQTRSVYKMLGADIEEYNGDNNFELPLASAFIIDTNGTITYSFVKADYTERADPYDVINKLKEL